MCLTMAPSLGRPFEDGREDKVKISELGRNDKTKVFVLVCRG